MVIPICGDQYVEQPTSTRCDIYQIAIEFVLFAPRRSQIPNPATKNHYVCGEETKPARHSQLVHTCFCRSDLSFVKQIPSYGISFCAPMPHSQLSFAYDLQRAM